MIYIITFITSLLFFRIALKLKKNNRKILFLLFSGLGLFFPCLLAALRDYTVGTDVLVYVKPYFDASLRFSSLSSYLEFLSFSDPLYLCLVYASKIFGDIGFLFFVSQLLVILPIYIVLLKEGKKENDVMLGMTIYFLFFYNQTFNMCRQSIAIAICLLAFMFFKNNNKKWILLFLISCLFHSSAIMFVFVILFYKIYSSNVISRKIKTLIFLMISLLTLLLTFYTKQIVALLVNIGVFNSEILIFINNYYSYSINFPLIFTFIYLLVFLIICFNKRNLLNIFKEHKIFDFWFFMSLYSLILLMINLRIEYGDRLSYYFFYLVLFNVIPLLSSKSLIKGQKNTIYLNYFIIIFFVVFWWYWIVMVGYHQTFPYVFR